MIKWTAGIALLLFLSPYLILFFHLGVSPVAWDSSWVRVMEFTLSQAFLSAVVCLFFGMTGALGLLKWQTNSRVLRQLEWICLLPNLVPPLFVINATLNAASWWGGYPLGLIGIVGLHAIINIGLVALLVSRLIAQKAGGWLELAQVEGASRWQLLIPVLKALEQDLIYIFFSLFVLFLTTFSIPLIVGGGRGTVFELFLYEKIHIDQDWGQAVWLSLSAGLLVLLFSLLLPKKTFPKANRPANCESLAWPAGIAVPMIIALGLVAGWAGGVLGGIMQISELAKFSSELMWAAFYSFGLGLLSGGLILILLLAVALAFSRAWLSRFLVGYLSPSTVLVGLALLLTGANSEVHAFFKISCGLALLILPPLYRLAGINYISSLHQQIETAQTLGASPRLIFRRVILPQVWAPYCWLAGIGAVWAVGDFALSTILAPHDFTLALMIKSLLSSYRLSQASVLLVPLLLIGVMCLLIFRELGRVADRKLHS